MRNERSQCSSCSPLERGGSAYKCKLRQNIRGVCRAGCAAVFSHPRIAGTGFVVDAFTPLQRGRLWALMLGLKNRFGVRIGEINALNALYAPLWRGETVPINANCAKISGVCAARAVRLFFHTPALPTPVSLLTHLPLSRGDGCGR